MVLFFGSYKRFIGIRCVFNVLEYIQVPFCYGSPPPSTPRRSNVKSNQRLQTDKTTVKRVSTDESLTFPCNTYRIYPMKQRLDTAL